MSLFKKKDPTAPEAPADTVISPWLTSCLQENTLAAVPPAKYRIR